MTTRHLKIRQKIVKIFEENNLKITSQANLKVVNFLNVTLDLKVEISSLTSSQVTDLYVSAQSNHLPSIIKNIPLAVNKRLCSISSNKQVFDELAPLCQA